MAQSILAAYPELNKTRVKPTVSTLKMRGKVVIDDTLGTDAIPIEEVDEPELGSDAIPIVEEPPLMVERYKKPTSIMDTPEVEVP
jgi:hypothetical protein